MIASYANDGAVCGHCDDVVDHLLRSLSDTSWGWPVSLIHVLG